MTSHDEWAFPYEEPVEEVAPAFHSAMSAWLSGVDDLTGLDRVTHELIRMVCTAIVRNPGGVERHARLAAEAGARWEQIATALLLTQPAFGLVPTVEGLPAARHGFETAEAAELDE